MFQQLGFGLAIAVILDATVIRSILVPASMELLGGPQLVLPVLAGVAARDSHRGPAATRARLGGGGRRGAVGRRGALDMRD